MSLLAAKHFGRVLMAAGLLLYFASLIPNIAALRFAGLALVLIGAFIDQTGRIQRQDLPDVVQQHGPRAGRALAWIGLPVMALGMVVVGGLSAYGYHRLERPIAAAVAVALTVGCVVLVGRESWWVHRAARLAHPISSSH